MRRIVVLALLLAACVETPAFRPCDADADCLPGACVRGVCQGSPDAASVDALTGDALRPDAATRDASPADAAVPADSGSDAAVLDAAAPADAAADTDAAVPADAGIDAAVSADAGIDAAAIDDAAPPDLGAPEVLGIDGPARVLAGATLEYTARVDGPPDAPLAYAWATEGGDFTTATDGAVVGWRAAAPGPASITVTVRRAGGGPAGGAALPIVAHAACGEVDGDEDGASPLAGCPDPDCDDRDPERRPGATERCDGADDDCDGAVDETATCPGDLQCVDAACACVGLDRCADRCVDLDTSLTDCGECGRACGAPNRADACFDGRCQPGLCLPDFVDVDGLPANGCECARESANERLCDAHDNDCDGRVDEDFGDVGGFCCADEPGRADVDCEQPGRLTCAADRGSAACDGRCSPARHAPTCNGEDDDCDGVRDEIEIGPIRPFNETPDPVDARLSLADHRNGADPSQGAVLYAADTDLDGANEVYVERAEPQVDVVEGEALRLDDGGARTADVRWSRAYTVAAWLRPQGELNPLRVARVDLGTPALDRAVEVPSRADASDVRITEVVDGYVVVWRETLDGARHVRAAGFADDGQLRFGPQTVDDGGAVGPPAAARYADEGTPATRVFWQEDGGRVRTRLVGDDGVMTAPETLADLRQAGERVESVTASATLRGALAMWIETRRGESRKVRRARFNLRGLMTDNGDLDEGCLATVDHISAIALLSMEDDGEFPDSPRHALTVVDDEARPRTAHLLTLGQSADECAEVAAEPVPAEATDLRGMLFLESGYIAFRGALGRIRITGFGAFDSNDDDATSAPVATTGWWPYFPRDPASLRHVAEPGRHIVYAPELPYDQTYVAVETDALLRATRVVRHRLPRTDGSEEPPEVGQIFFWDGGVWLGAWMPDREGQGRIVLLPLGADLRPAGAPVVVVDDTRDRFPRDAVVGADGDLYLVRGPRFLRVAAGTHEVTTTLSDHPALLQASVDARLDPTGYDWYWTTDADGRAAIHALRFTLDGVPAGAEAVLPTADVPANQCRRAVSARDVFVAICEAGRTSRALIWEGSGQRPLSEELPVHWSVPSLFKYAPDRVAYVFPTGPDEMVFNVWSEGALPELTVTVSLGSPGWHAVFPDRSRMVWATIDVDGRVSAQAVNCH